VKTPIAIIKIGNLTLKNNLFLSPMAQIGNMAFRLLCLEGGAGMLFTEMISAESLFYSNKKSFEMLRMAPEEKYTAIQIFGSKKESMAQAAKTCQLRGACAVDINAGCPVKKIMRSGSGAMLMKNPRLLSEIVGYVKKAGNIPVTVKLRSSFAEGEIASPSHARICEDAGANAVTFHARSVASGHSGKVDFRALELTAKAVKIPLIGNGGVKTAEDAQKMFNAGCSAVSIGRAAASDPFIFKRIQDQLEGKEEKDTSPREKIDLFLKFLKLNCNLYGPKWGIVRARKLVGYWLKNMPNAALLRASFMEAESLEDAEKTFRKWTEK